MSENTTGQERALKRIEREIEKMEAKRSADLNEGQAANLEGCIFGLEIAQSILSALPHQPATDEGEVLAFRKAINTILAELIAPYEPDFVKRVEIGNAACDKIAILSTPPSPASDTMLRALEQCAAVLPRFVHSTSEDDKHVEGRRAYQAAIRALANSPKTEAPAEVQQGVAWQALRAIANLRQHSREDDADNAATMEDIARRALATPQPTETRMPCPDLLDGSHGEAVDWITANCSAIRRDNGDMDYSLGAMISAYEAGKASAQPPAEVQQPVAWMYEKEDGERTFEFNPNGDSARWLLENGYTEQPLYATPQQGQEVELREAKRVLGDLVEALSGEPEEVFAGEIGTELRSAKAFLATPTAAGESR